ncbi:MAG: type II toxin-antitoxin system RelE/ParE family toxin [Candidatus Nitrotoga sp.]|nr:type II toxin-antitoxin system RelE/ParE family toxin [Candidatus Nitrotoga sp.]MDP1856122.1 type II toxin-antitoxin system RelE/ParE family toxin [Candidatus Nitrotoga sp.]RFC37978.1 MAG: addiction module toxin, RelE/StbE family [Candidatus Nitrotoga sp. CP45]
MKVRWSEAAIQDRREIVNFIALNNLLAAIHMDELFDRAAERLAEHPYLGRISELAGTRELIPHESYRLVYEISGETVWILSLNHTTRQWPPEID